MTLRDWIREHNLLAFGLIAFGWTWGWDGIFYVLGLWELIPVSIPRVWGPAIAAVIIIWASDISLRTWIRRRLDWRVPPGLFLLALMIPLFITNVQPVVEALGGGSLVYNPPVAVDPAVAFALAVVFVVVNMFVLGGTEEIGWRGIMQPRLQHQMSVFTAGLTIGAVWWAWHLPLFFTGDPNYSLEIEPFLSYTLFVLGSSTVLGAFVNLTEGNVLPVMLMHASVNLGAFIAADGGILEGSALVPLLVGAGLWWILAGLLIARYGLSMTPKSDLTPLSSRTVAQPGD